MPVLLFASGIEDANTYHANSTLQWRMAMDTIDLLPWSDVENILDIGCGDGKVTAFLAKKVAKASIIGIDISQSMIDFASSKYTKTDYPNLEFQRQDAGEISFENQFDRVVSFSTLHWVLDQAKVLKAIHRALISGGQICLHTYGKGNMNATDIGDYLVHTEKWKAYFPSYTKQRVFFTEQEFYFLLEEAGFKNIQVIGSWNVTTYANRQALFDFANPLLNFIRHLPQDLQHEFVEEVVDRIISIAGQNSDGSIDYHTFNLQAIATK